MAGTVLNGTGLLNGTALLSGTGLLSGTELAARGVDVGAAGVADRDVHPPPAEVVRERVDTVA